jgi:UDPglucose--hexose-1-phosphate uridylyltransferase
LVVIRYEVTSKGRIIAMPSDELGKLTFASQTVSAKFMDPGGQLVERPIEIRTNPLTGRTCRIAFSRVNEKETGTNALPPPPPDAGDTANCPFCRPQVESRTPQLHPDLTGEGRLSCKESLLFPNLFPYGSYSAVSLFNNDHFVEIGQASHSSYTNCFVNCCRYLSAVINHDPRAVYMAITQNHLPSAGGSLVHPHLQINADSVAANYQRVLLQRVNDYYQHSGNYFFSRYIEQEKRNGSRLIGRTGAWEWVAAYAPEGFFEIWGVLPHVTSFQKPDIADWEDLVRGVMNIQRFYRSLNRNGYNMGLLAVEIPASRLELRIVMTVRSNYAPWVRSDHTGFEVMLGDMTTFVAPEQTAEWARAFFES